MSYLNSRTSGYIVRNRGLSQSNKFHLKHVFRAGAIVWLKSNNLDYYVVFRSLSRPNRGIQLPGGRIERNENPAQAILREVKEETGIETKIICPLGTLYFENPEDNYSNLQIYYIVRPLFPLDVNKKWKYTDKDRTQQELECWFSPVDNPATFLAAGQGQIVDMFKQWLEEHSPENSEKIKQITGKGKTVIEDNNFSQSFSQGNPVGLVSKSFVGKSDFTDELIELN